MCAGTRVCVDYVYVYHVSAIPVYVMVIVFQLFDVTQLIMLHSPTKAPVTHFQVY